MAEENTDLRLTVQAWTDIVIDNWLDRLAKLNIGYYFQLEDSLNFEIIGNGALPAEVRLMFNYYGKFVDMGVGKGVKLEDVKSNRMEFSAGLEGASRRRPKKWYSKVFYSEVMKLGDILARKYGRMGMLSIVENLDDNALRWQSQTI
jgi:hypothetical protein